MINNVLASELAAQHNRDLRTHAEAFRRTRAARSASGRPTSAEQVMRAGRAATARLGGVHIRPLRPTDQALVRNVFDHLSPRSRWLRFLGPKSALTDTELSYFTAVDHHDHEALVAISRFGGRPLAVARYVRSRDDSGSADVAIAVIDSWQRLGVGRMLAMQLAARARCEGVHRFSALISADNRGAKSLLATLGTVRVRERAAGTVHYEVALTADKPVAGGFRASPALAGCA